MRAWTVTGVGEPGDVLELVERPEPVPESGEVLVEVGAAGIGLPDLLMCRDAYAYRPPRPFTPGQEVVGVVVDHTDVTGVAVGDRVMGVTAFPKGWGGFAERTLIGERSLFAVPDEMPDAEAAGFSIAYRTAWIGLVVRGGLKPGETLVVTGATGGTGAAAVQVGAALGARVLAVAGGPKVETCRHDGADATIDHRRDDLTRAVLDLTDGRGADLAFDPVGGDVFQQCLDALAPGGRLLAVGFAAGAWSDASTAQLVRRNLSVVGVLASLADRGESQAVQDGLVALYRQGRIQPRVADVVGFADLPDALERLAGRRVGGRLVLDVAGALGTG